VYEKSLNEAELILSAQKDAILPVRKIWDEVAKKSKQKGYEVASLPDFSAMLDGDGRFQIIPAQNKNSEDQDILVEDEFGDTEMENLGFYSEDRVKLKASRVAAQINVEDDEEVGSIKRKAFAGQVVQVKKNTTTFKKSAKKKLSKSTASKVKLKSKNKNKLKSRTKGSK
jgi:hypothetical protein